MNSTASSHHLDQMEIHNQCQNKLELVKDNEYDDNDDDDRGDTNFNENGDFDASYGVGDRQADR